MSNVVTLPVRLRKRPVTGAPLLAAACDAALMVLGGNTVAAFSLAAGGTPNALAIGVASALTALAGAAIARLARGE